MKIGDKVRFLSEVGGGIVTGFQGKDIALVEDADGFDIPMPVRECVVIDADDYNIKRKPVAQKDVPDAAKSKGAVQTVKKSMEEEEDERPITYRAAERKGGDVLNVMLAFVPQDIKAISSTGFDAYIINDSNFENEVLNYNGKILIDFWAEWCGPCKMMTPVFQELEKSFNNIKFCKINVDECSALAERFGVMSIPTFILFENGKAVKQMTGARPKSELVNYFNLDIDSKI